jgi:hypothetical protein
MMENRQVNIYFTTERGVIMTQVLTFLCIKESHKQLIRKSLLAKGYCM